MTKIKSSWEIEENAYTFLEQERGAVPGEELQLAIIEHILSEWVSSPSSILDLGCGDGILGRFIMSKFPSAKVIFVDFSDTMLKAAHEKLSNIPDPVLVKADFGYSNWLGSVSSYKPFDVIISGFAIHHQPDNRKKEIYKEIYEILSPGGVFINLEHVESSTPAVGQLFEEFYIGHLYDFQLKSDPNASKAEAAKIYRQRPDKNEDKLAPVDLQCQWLREIGFNDVDCFFKMYEIGLFGGRK